MPVVSEREPQAARTRYLNRLDPVDMNPIDMNPIDMNPIDMNPIEMIENDGQDGAWLNLRDGWVKIAAVKNLWDIDGDDQGAKPFVRMHFQVVAESGRQIFLFQDLIDGSWYQEIPPGSDE